jgi:hypothetical protein
MDWTVINTNLEPIIHARECYRGHYKSNTRSGLSVLRKDDRNGASFSRARGISAPSSGDLTTLRPALSEETKLDCG